MINVIKYIDKSQNKYWNIQFIMVTNREENTYWKIRPELVDALIEKYGFYKKRNLDDIIKEYTKNYSQEDFNKDFNAELKARDNFVNKFSKNYILNMNIDDYVIGKSRIDELGKESFCYIIEPATRRLGEMRGATADKFGIYYSNDGKYEFAKKYGNNLKEAFNNIKNEIIKLIEQGEKEDFDGIKNNILSTMFKGKILSFYYPEKYIDIFKEEDIDKI